MLRERALAGMPDPESPDGWRIKPIQVNEDTNICEYGAFEYIYAKYDRKDGIKDLFLNKVGVDDSGLRHPFNSATRLRILGEILHNPRFCSFDLERWSTDQKSRKWNHFGLRMCFAIHNSKRVAELKSKWVRWLAPPWAEEPFDRVKDYFGEQIGNKSESHMVSKQV